MTILSDRWKGLRNVPHVALAALPTDVEALPALSRRAGAELWIKRDDRTAAAYGGNKVRKLEYVLGEALSRGADTLITSGAAGSHHCLATATFAGTVGLDVHSVIVPQPYSAHAEANLRALVGSSSEVHAAGGPASALRKTTMLAARLRLRGKRPMIVPPGGTSVAGVLGYVEAGLELARQVEAHVLAEPDAIFVPLGTGGTAAGLAIGIAASGITAKIIGVRVVPRAVANGVLIGRLIQRTVSHLRSLDDRFPDVADDARRRLEIDHGEYGDGYGAATSAGRNAERLLAEAGVTLDPTYTAKASAAALRRAGADLSGQTLLITHTLSSAKPAAAAIHQPLAKPMRRLLAR